MKHKQITATPNSETDDYWLFDAVDWWMGHMGVVDDTQFITDATLWMLDDKTVYMSASVPGVGTVKCTVTVEEIKEREYEFAHIAHMCDTKLLEWVEE